MLKFNRKFRCLRVKIKLYEEEGFKMVDWSGLKWGPLNFDFWLVLKSVNWKIILIGFICKASGSILIILSREGCMNSVLWLTENHLWFSFNTFAASYLNTQGLNNSCFKSPASTLVDLTFQSRTLRSFSLNQLCNLSL